MHIEGKQKVGDIAAEHPESLRVFESTGIDYCCGGGKSLDEACSASKLSVDEVVTRIADAERKAHGADDLTDWNNETLAALATHIVDRHHVYVRQELPRLKALLGEVLAKHGESQQSLKTLVRLFDLLGAELAPHMAKEEQVLFPYVRRLEQQARNGEPWTPPFFGNVSNPVGAMMREHDNAGELLRQIRRETADFRVPEGGCAKFNALYRGLEQFEKDLHRHIHLENNILFPRALELETKAARRRTWLQYQQKYGKYMVLFSLLVAIAAVVAAVWTSRSTAAAQRLAPAEQELVLTPKADLRPEMGAWSFAPNVPPPITRTGQRRVVVNWEVKETQAEIAPGLIYDDYWAFEGKVPGPLLRVRVGDLVEIHLKNGISSGQPHNIDFHFVLGPGGGASALSVGPGETAKLEARAMAPGLFMFHCATPDIPTHIANGMYGFVLVEPEGGLPKVDKEFYVVQSEFYTQPAAEPGHLKYSVERGNKFDAEYVVFNGAVGAMMGDKAPRAYVDDRIRLFVGNAGPNLISSFHVIGQVFDYVYREGDLISPPARAIQTTTIPAGGAAAVEFKPRVPGTFLIVDHAIFRLHQGGVGSINVTGPANAEIYAPGDAAKAAVDTHADSHNPPPAQPAGHDAHAAPATTATPAQEPQAPATPAPAASGPALSGTVLVEIMMGSANFDKNPSNDFSPTVIRIKRGATVKWVNKDTMIHDVKADDGSFASGLMKQYETWSKKFDKAGSFPYTCMPHPWMKGTIVVE